MRTQRRTRFYYVQFDDDERNFDLIVEANRASQAVRLWRDYFKLTPNSYPHDVLGLPFPSGTVCAIPWFGGNNGMFHAIWWSLLVGRPPAHAEVA